jgi:hypothetical protein
VESARASVGSGADDLHNLAIDIQLQSDDARLQNGQRLGAGDPVDFGGIGSRSETKTKQLDQGCLARTASSDDDVQSRGELNVKPV